MEKESKYKIFRCSVEMANTSGFDCKTQHDTDYALQLLQSEESRANAAEARNRELEAERDAALKERDLARAERGIFLTDLDELRAELAALKAAPAPCGWGEPSLYMAYRFGVMVGNRGDDGPPASFETLINEVDDIEIWGDREKRMLNWQRFLATARERGMFHAPVAATPEARARVIVEALEQEQLILPFTAEDCMDQLRAKGLICEAAPAPGWKPGDKFYLSDDPDFPRTARAVYESNGETLIEFDDPDSYGDDRYNADDVYRTASAAHLARAEELRKSAAEHEANAKEVATNGEKED
jgi:hypothetical protein